MIAALLLRAIVVGAIVTLAAMLAERALAAFGRPTRFVYLAALLLAAALAALGAAVGDRAGARASLTGDAANQRQDVTAPGAREVSNADVDEAAAWNARWWTRRDLHAPSWLAALDRPLLVAWLLASLVWGAILVASTVRLQRQRPTWRPSVLDGVPVYLSHDVGPALFGLARFGIVVPSWVLDLEPTRRRLIVAHEREHARAGDPVTLLTGALLVLLQPLNPFAWLCFRRLRLAIEIDCDARVLALVGDVRSYGELLLDVGERALAGAAPVVALSEAGAQLGRRIAAMSRPLAANRAWRAFAAASVALILTAAAWRVPRVAAAEPEAASNASRIQTTQAGGARVIVRIHEVGLYDADPTPTVLVWGMDGPISVGIGNEPMRRVTDTLRLHSLPAMRLDVTDGHAIVRLVGRGYMRLGATVEGGAATRLDGTSPQVAFLRGGTGVVLGNEVPRAPIRDESPKPAPDSLVRRQVAARFPGIFDGTYGENPIVWVHADVNERIVFAAEGRKGLLRDPSGRGNFTYQGARTMLPDIGTSLQPREYWGTYSFATTNGGKVQVVWVHKRR